MKLFVTVSSAQTRNECITSLFSELVERQTVLFSKDEVITFVIGNYGEIPQLKHQCGEHSALQMLDTHEMAKKVRRYTNPMFGDIKITLKYTPHQNYPPPVMMADYENIGNVSNATIYTKHKSRALSTEQCRTGSRVRQYMAWLYDST
jgi:hypothetical protein